ncbi:type I polyketide synthase [Nonomuraea candida]|uniref:type I polyketide synthase n=1 Tax=Nonomuraea candida TaxID=359159 RepID=UPI0006937115|nr:type I polyketide synthase [Nonomuraea candida]
MIIDDVDDSGFVAVTAMAGRFPGASDVETFWDNLCDGRESVSVLSDQLPAAADRYVPSYGLLSDPELFDAGYFDYSPEDALIMDPQHRLLLECAHEALERAGHGGPERLPTGVFVGGSVTDHGALVRAWGHARGVPLPDTRVQQANDIDFLATRIAYKLGLTGPAMAVQTACSSSLVAVHLAIGSLLAGDCAMAVAGGASVPATIPTLRHDPDDIFADDGRCRPFDAHGRGTVRASAVGLVVLRPLAEALEDGDHVHAVIRGTAVNNDGRRKMGFHVPSVAGPAEAARTAQLVAGVGADEIGYVEAHGTGSALGDPVEVAGLTKAFRQSTDRTGYCRIGSVKANIGHADAAAGIVGLIKTVLCVEHGVLPASLNFTEPNREIDFASSPFVVNDRTVPWESAGRTRIAATNVLAFGGTNAHAVVAEAPAALPTTPGRPEHLLVFSARTRPALQNVARRLADHLERHPDADLADVAWTLQTGRAMHPERHFVVAADVPEAIAALRGSPPAGNGPGHPGRRRTVFLFAEPGDDRAGSVAAIHGAEQVFRAHLDEIAEAAHPHLGHDLRRALLAAPDLESTPAGPAAHLAVQYATARLLMSWGLYPDAVAGHGRGAHCAAAIAAELSPADTARLLVTLTGAGADVADGAPARPGRPVLCDVRAALDGAPGQIVVHIGAERPAAPATGAAEPVYVDALDGPGRPPTGLEPVYVDVLDEPGRPPTGLEPVYVDVLDEPGRPPTGLRTALAAAGRLWAAGATVDFAALHSGERRRRLRLPTYPFERRPYLVPRHPTSPSYGETPVNDIERAIGSMLVTNLFVEVPESRLTPDDRLRGDLGLDSLGFVELRVQCEDTFGITISDAHFTPENFTSIRTVADLVRTLQGSSLTAGD